jgi:hypothetical protein
MSEQKLPAAAVSYPELAFTRCLPSVPGCPARLIKPPAPLEECAGFWHYTDQWQADSGTVILVWRWVWHKNIPFPQRGDS